MGFPGGAVGKESPANAGDTETWAWSLGQENPLEWERETHSSILSWKIPWEEDPVGYSPRGSKESDVTEHACIIRIPMGK